MAIISKGQITITNINDGITYYTWIKYADSSTGSGLSDSPDGKSYIGMAYNKTTPTESTVASDYTWSLIKGPTGATGPQGTTGANGVTYYTWIRYSDYADGTSLYSTPTSTTQYIGIAINKTSSTPSSTKTDYTWSKFKGDTGVQGPTGSTGATGPQGPTGPPLYTWIKYATSSTGAGLSDSPTGMTYIGFAYNKTTPTESTTASDYTWSLIKGDTGSTGSKGADGITYYTWIKYSNYADGTSLYDTPTSSTLYIGIATNKTSATKSTTKTDYVWSKFKGDTGVQGPTGSTGATGPQGPTGAQGISVTSVVLEYSSNTSTTTAPTTGWSTTMPSYVSGSYLWMRTGVKYSNSSSYTYATPVCDQSWKVSSDTYSQYQQLKTQFSWIVQSGTSASSMILTDALYSLLSQKIILKGANIEITGDTVFKGMVTANDYFRILSDGSAEARDFSVAGVLSTRDFSVTTINNSRYAQNLDSDISVTINPSATVSEEDWYDGAVYKSYADLNNAIPKNLQGYTLTINLASDLTENIRIDDFVNGRIKLQLCKFTLKGWIANEVMNTRLDIFGNKDGTTGGTTNFGSIMPNAGYLSSSYRYAIATIWSPLRVWDLKIYKNNSTDVNTGCIFANNGVVCYIANSMPVNNPYLFLRCHAGAYAYVSDSSGTVIDKPFHAVSGGKIVLNNTTQAGKLNGGTTASAHYWTANNGEVVATGVTWSTTSNTGTNNNTGVGTITKTVTISSSGGDTYRSSYSIGWRGDNTVRQGNYGYGESVGCWFFGSQISSYAGKSISKIVIKFKRQAGGINASVTHGIKLHNYTSRPASAPTFLSTLSKTVGCAVGDTATITLTSASEISAFKAAKGFGIVASATNSSSLYSVCSGSATVAITYTE